MKHPTPWQWEWQDEPGEESHDELVDKNGDIIDFLDPETADYAMQSVNAHDGMAAALEVVAGCQCNFPDWWYEKRDEQGTPYLSSYADQVTDALAAAKGGTQ